MRIKFNNLYKNFNKSKKIFKNFNSLLKNNELMGGKYIESFERKISKYFGVKHCISVGNGTDAIEIALESLNLKKNSEVIIPANTWISTASAVVRQNLNLVFCDIDLQDFNLCVKDLENKINKKTSAIIVVHLFGKAAKMNDILKLTKKNNIKIIEDCAQSSGTKINNKHVGTYGDIGAISFYPTKNLGAYGDGGCILTNNHKINLKCRRIKNHGSLLRHDHQLIGRNSRLDNFQAVVITEKLKRLNFDIKKKNHIAKRYIDKLSILKDFILLPKHYTNEVHSFHQFVIICKHRNKLKNFLIKNKIETLIHYPKMLCDLSIFRHISSKDKVTNSKKLGNKLLSLPISSEHQFKEINYICEKIIFFYEKKIFLSKI